MPRQEASLEDRPQHLRSFCEALREVRRESGLTLKELSKRTHYSESTLSRVTNALDLPAWPQVEAFLIGCGGGDLDRWFKAWEKTNAQHELFLKKGVDAPPASRFQDLQPGEVEQLFLNRPQTLTAFLQHVQTTQDLGRAIRTLGERTEVYSLRQMQERCEAAGTRIGKSTIRDWLVGERRPTPSRLEELVTALGATPIERRYFMECLTRVWSAGPPRLQILSKPSYSELGTRRGGHCCIVTITAYERSILGGLVQIRELTVGSIAAGRVVVSQPGVRVGIVEDRAIDGILGISTGPAHAVAGQIALIPKTQRLQDFEVGIWVTSPMDVADMQVELELNVETGDKIWPVRLEFQMPPSIRPAALSPETVARAAALSRTKPTPRSRREVRRVPLPAPRPTEPASQESEPETYTPKHRREKRSRGLLGWLRGKSSN